MSSTSSGSNLEDRFDAAARPKDGVQQSQRHLHATGPAKLTSGHHSRGSASKSAGFSMNGHRVRDPDRRISSLRSTGLTNTASPNMFPGQAACTLTKEGMHAVLHHLAGAIMPSIGNASMGLGGIVAAHSAFLHLRSILATYRHQFCALVATLKLQPAQTIKSLAAFIVKRLKCISISPRLGLAAFAAGLIIRLAPSYTSITSDTLVDTSETNNGVNAASRHQTTRGGTRLPLTTPTALSESEQDSEPSDDPESDSDDVAMQSNDPDVDGDACSQCDDDDESNFWLQPPEKHTRLPLTSEEIKQHRYAVEPEAYAHWSAKFASFLTVRNPQAAALYKLSYEDAAELVLAYPIANAANAWLASAQRALIDESKAKGELFMKELIETELEEPEISSSGIDIAERLRAYVAEPCRTDQEKMWQELQSATPLS